MILYRRGGLSFHPVLVAVVFCSYIGFGRVLEDFLQYPLFVILFLRGTVATVTFHD